MNRSIHLDVLRALAVFLVISHHAYAPPQSIFGAGFILSIIQGGWVGVDLFFVLSGFLVSGLLFREHEKYGSLRLGSFLARRAFKIYPSFWVLLILVTVRRFSQGAEDIWPAFFSELFFIQNYGPSLMIHSWSLAVEEHFYLLLTLVFWGLSCNSSEAPFTKIPMLCASACVLCLALRIWTSSEWPFSPKSHHFPTHLRLDSLSFGVLLSYWFYRSPESFRRQAFRFRYLWLLAGLILLFPAFVWPLHQTPFIFTWGYVLFYFAAACLVIASQGFDSSSTFVSRALAMVGMHSYSIYLWHLFVAAIFVPLLMREAPSSGQWLLYFVFYFLGSLVVGIGMARLIEYPMLKLRDRLIPSRSENSQ